MQVAMVRQRQRVHPMRLRPLDQSIDRTRPIQQTV